MSHNAGELAGLQDLEVPTAEMRDMFGMAWSGLEHYAQMLAEEGQLRGLIGPRELPRLYSRHLVNSAAVVPFLPRHGSVADLGSGAGLPGVVVALSRPDLEVTLIEPMERRCAWLELVAEELDLDNVRVWRGRAEEMRERFDVVTARAVANLSKLTRMASPLIAPGGVLLALKGEQAQREMPSTSLRRPSCCRRCCMKWLLATTTSPAWWRCVGPAKAGSG